MNLKSLLKTLSPDISYTVYCQTFQGLPASILNQDEISDRLDYKVVFIEVPKEFEMVITLQSPKLV